MKPGLMPTTELSQRLIPVCRILVLYFNAEADLQESAVCQHSARQDLVPGKWGESMGRIRRAAEGLLRAEGLIGTLPGTLDEAQYIPDAVRSQLNLARQRLGAAIETNGMQFREVEVPSTALRDIEPKRMATLPNVSSEFDIREIRPELQPLLDL